MAPRTRKSRMRIVIEPRLRQPLKFYVPARNQGKLRFSSRNSRRTCGASRPPRAARRIPPRNPRILQSRRRHRMTLRTRLVPQQLFGARHSLGYPLRCRDSPRLRASLAPSQTPPICHDLRRVVGWYGSGSLNRSGLII